MKKDFKQLNFFYHDSPEKKFISPPSVKKKISSSQPLVDSLSETTAKVNALYYLRNINRSSQNHLIGRAYKIDKKIFMISLYNEIKLKKGILPSPLCSQDALICQNLFSKG